ncbi:MAG: MotA/TolQ/ExbB proton channel family protein [Halothiobacillaceae bacterium]|jgi:chemotaxis protein MotA|nr:MotA/TolQ/ExbB proton channel family protein [Halothiobacillaceae bacterium]
MDFATLLGIIGAFAVMVAAIAVGGDMAIFFNIPSLFIVVGGTLGVTIAMITFPQFIESFKVIFKAFTHKPVDQIALIDEAAHLAQIARREGILALEREEISNPFLLRGVLLCVDGHAPQVVQMMLTRDINMMLQRHENGQRMMKAVFDVAPAMGMIGTLIGLVQMLTNMDDPKKIGPAMAVALLTTLYGALIAQVVALPIMEKLALRTQEETLNKQIILEAVNGIQEGLNPKVLRELLLSFLPENRRPASDYSPGGEGSAS